MQIIEFVMFGIIAVCVLLFFISAYISKTGRLYMHHVGCCNPAKCDCDEYVNTMSESSVIAKRYAVSLLIAVAIYYFV